ncbi:MAG: radical SAM protein [Candidatus Woesearchaeota archaeon]|nr:radical SAM protein [Candidatus Woesearchaeota archaeon]
MKVALINPYVGSATHGRKEGEQLIYNYRRPPLELSYIANLLQKKGVNVKIIDGNIEELPPKNAALRAKDSDIIFVATAPYDKWQCPVLHFDHVMPYLKALREINSQSKIYLFGPHVSIDPEYFLNSGYVDALIVGEPEMKAVDLCFKRKEDVPSVMWKHNGKYIKSKKKDEYADIDKLFPAFEQLPMKKYEYQFLGKPTAVLETSRGCPYQCTFCFKDMVSSNYRMKSISHVISELNYTVNKFKVRNIFFHDSELTLNKKRTDDLCKAIIKNNLKIRWACQTRADTIDLETLKLMKKSGCRLLCFGIESGSDEVLKRIRKNISVEKIRRGISLSNKAGIETAGFFIIGLPDDTEKSINETINLAKQLPLDYATFQILTPYPNTAIYREFKSHFKEKFPKSFTLNFTPAELEEIKNKAFAQFYFRPSYVFRVFLKLIKHPILTFKKFKLFLDYI